MTTSLQQGVAPMLLFGGYEHSGNGRRGCPEGFLPNSETTSVGLR